MLSTDCVAFRPSACAEALRRSQWRSRSGVTPSKARAPSKTEEPSQKACVRGPATRTLPSCQSPSSHVQVSDHFAIRAFLLMSGCRSRLLMAQKLAQHYGAIATIATSGPLTTGAGGGEGVGGKRQHRKLGSADRHGSMESGTRSRAKLGATPIATGSSTAKKTMEMVLVSRASAIVDVLPPPAIAWGFSATSSFANL